MLYDYLISNWININCSIFIVMLLAAIVGVMHKVSAETASVPYKRWITWGGISLALVLLFFLFLFPNKEWFIRHYGDPTTHLTDAQAANLEQQYRRSELLFYSCLERGQKQPNSAVFNDTNEVVKTCYNVAKLKF